jgi:hypothetical protein
LPDGASSVERLDLRENPLTTLDLAASQESLQDLNISFTAITSLEFLRGFEQLGKLSFFDNIPANVVFPDGLSGLKILELHDYCDGAKCLDQPPLHPLHRVELPASVDLAQLRTRGFPKNMVSIRGFWMYPPVAASNGQVKLRLNGAAGRTVQVQSSADLLNWDNWQTVVLGSAGAELVDDRQTSNLRFFRVIGTEGN